MGSRLFDFAEVEFDHQDFLLVGAGLGKNFPGGSRDKALAPEFNPIAGQFFMPDTIGNDNIATISNRMAPLNGFPGVVL